MLSKDITYKDYNDVTRTKKFYFHLSKAELLELELSTPKGIEAMYNESMAVVAKEKDNPSESVSKEAMDVRRNVMSFFKELILSSVGEKSTDGQKFVKTQSFREEFATSEAFSELYVELLSSKETAETFVKAVLPSGSV